MTLAAPPEDEDELLEDPDEELDVPPEVVFFAGGFSLNLVKESGIQPTMSNKDETKNNSFFAFIPSYYRLPFKNFYGLEK
ncbi:MAG: hypothetical protein OHK0056_30340 [Bacteriovoracaceae bacterium]